MLGVGEMTHNPAMKMAASSTSLDVQSPKALRRGGLRPLASATGPGVGPECAPRRSTVTQQQSTDR
jgi:hypothetical protein